ncbi:MAG: GntR family transcriptional regulator [Enterobacteriaceae bacterium]
MQRESITDNGLTDIASDSASVLNGYKTLAHGAYNALRQDIIEGRLAPGSRLRVEHLKNHYQVSAATLREALTLLVSDALVMTSGQRGFTVKPISVEDFADLTESRIVLESHALRTSIAAGDDEWEANLTAAFHRLHLAQNRLDKGEASFTQWEVRNREFHYALLAAHTSFWSQHFLSILYRQSERYRRLLLSKQPVERNLHQEHQALFEASLRRDADEACELLARHIRASFIAISTLLQNSLDG